MKNAIRTQLRLQRLNGNGDVMKAYSKDIFETIRKERKRFIAIAIIVMLGVTMVTGIKAGCDDLLYSADRFFDEQKLHDIAIQSTLGLTDEDVKVLSELDGVEYAEGFYSEIVNLRVDGINKTAEVKMITDSGINMPYVLEGVLPVAPGEIAVTRDYLNQTGKKLGDVLVFEEDIEEEEEEESEDSESKEGASDEEDDELSFELEEEVEEPTFANTECVITAVVVDPTSVNLTEGAAASMRSSTGADYIFFVPKAAVNSDVYSAVFLKLTGTEAVICYSDDYKNIVNSVIDEIAAQIQAGREKARTDEIVDEANDKIADAEETMNEEFAKADKEIADAKAEIEDAKKEIADGEKELAEKTAEADSEIAKAKADIEEAKAELLHGEGELIAAEAELEAGLAEIAAGEAQIATNRADLDGAQAEIDAGRAEIEAAKAQLAAMEEAMGIQMPEAWAEIAANEAALDAAQAQVDAGKGELEAGEAALSAAKEELEAGRAQIDEGWSAIYYGWEELEKGIKELNEQEADAYKKIEEGRQELEDGKVELADGEKELYENVAEYNDKRAEAEEKLADAKAEIADLDTAKWYILDRDNMSGYNNIYTDSSAISVLGKIIPIIFLVVAILISLTTINRMVEEDRGLLGTYQALGYTDGEICGKYNIYALCASVVGGLLGLVCGYIILPQIIFIVFGNMYVLPQYWMHFDWAYGIGGPLLFVVVIVLTAWYTCKAALKNMPAELMRPKAPRAGSRVFLEYIGFIWNRFSFLNKVTARNLFRYKKRLFMTVFGIAGCTGLLITGFAIKDTITELMPRQYGEIFHFQMMAVTQPEDYEKLIEFADSRGEILDYLSLKIDTVTLKNADGATDSVQLYVVPDGLDISGYVNLQNITNKQTLKVPENGVLVTRNSAQMLEFGEDDVIYLQDMQLKQFEFEVAAINENFMGNFVFMVQSTYEKTFGAYEENAVLAKLSPDIDQVAFVDNLGQEDWVLSVMSTQAMKDDFETVFGLINMVVYVIIFLSASLAFVVLFTLSTTNISERERELATIKVLGFFDNEVHLYVNKETIILTMIGILCGIPLGTALGHALTAVLAMPSIYFAVTIYKVSYGFSAALTLVFAMIVNTITNRSLNRIDPVEALKSIE